MLYIKNYQRPNGKTGHQHITASICTMAFRRLGLPLANLERPRVGSAPAKERAEVAQAAQEPKAGATRATLAVPATGAAKFLANLKGNEAGI